MRTVRVPDGREPGIAVGLLEDVDQIAVHLKGDFSDSSGMSMPNGDYRLSCLDTTLRMTGPAALESEEIVLTPKDPSTNRFSVKTTIGLDFHWQQRQTQTFVGRLRFIAASQSRLTLINEVSLETYLTSVICSEMSPSSPVELIKAHAVISRSWLLAQREKRSAHRRPVVPAGKERSGEILRWYDHEAHAAFDVCADDHCQRYHGVSGVLSAEARGAVGETRGRVLAFEGRVCDARYSKCCGGVTEDFRVAWGDEAIPYLVPVLDGPEGRMPDPPLTEEAALREYLRRPPDVYCNCRDEGVLDAVLAPLDRKTDDFFRWKTELSALRASRLLLGKSGADLGRILALEPVERGHSGRLKRLRWVGEKGSLMIGKELEIRRLLSSSHLYSSAFVVDPEGPDRRPDSFVLRGAGWGHGVGLCQIGAAVMAWQGRGHEAILRHYYPGTDLVRAYE